MCDLERSAMELTLTNPDLRLRAIDDDDLEELLEIYASNRQPDMDRVPHWDIPQKEAFVKSQFHVQHRYYLSNYSGGDFWLIESGGQVIGRLYVHEHFQQKGIRIIDITIKPAFRNQGLGRGILMDLMNKASSLGRPLSIHVESYNPAKNLYARLGFRKISETNGVYHLMEWRPSI